MDRVTQANVEKLATDLAVKFDETMKDRWGERSGVIAVAFEDGDGLEVAVRDNIADPKVSLAELIEFGPALFVCTSSLGHASSWDPDNPFDRERVRATVALTRKTDLSLLRFRDGRVRRLEGGAVGAVVDLMRLVIAAPARH